MNGKRLVICGYGMETALGNREETQIGLESGRSGISVLTDLQNYEHSPIQIGGRINREDFDRRYETRLRQFQEHLGLNDKDLSAFTREPDYFTRFGVSALLEAIGSPKVLASIQSEIDPTRLSVCFGTGIGGVQHLQELCQNVLGGIKKQRTRPGRAAIEMLPDRLACVVSKFTQSKGMKACPVLACATGIAALIEACGWLMLDWTDLVFVGASEAALKEAGLASFLSISALNYNFNNNPAAASCPFNKTREGFVMAEGAAAFIVTTLEVALRCGLKILAEIIGFGNTSDAGHETKPDQDGMSRALEQSLGMAKIGPSEIDLILAHGTSTPMNDKLETQAIKMAYGGKAYLIPVSAPKSMIGHSLGAVGAVQVGIGIGVMYSGIIPPTINLSEPDPECDLDYVPNFPMGRKVSIVSTNAFGFGGSNTNFLTRKWVA